MSDIQRALATIERLQTECSQAEKERDAWREYAIAAVDHFRKGRGEERLTIAHEALLDMGIDPLRQPA